MSTETALRAHLIADPGVASRVGTRIHPDVLPQAPAYPAIRYQLISRPRAAVLSGPASRVRARIQLDCFAETKAAAAGLAAAAIAALDGATFTADGLRCAARIDNEGSDFEPDVAIYRARVDVLIGHAA